MIAAVKEEIIGPTIDFKGANYIHEQSNETDKNDGNFYYYKLNGKEEEIVTIGKPSRKYAAAILYPRETLNDKLPSEDEEIDIIDDTDIEEEDASDEDFTPEEFNQSSRKPYKKPTFGYTFAVPDETKDLNLTFSCGVYDKKSDFNYPVQKNAEWWFRKTLGLEIVIDINTGQTLTKKELDLFDFSGKIDKKRKIKLYTTVRRINTLKNGKKIKIVTILLENITKVNREDEPEETLLFQCESSATIDSELSFLQYPSASDLEANIPQEDKKFEMLYLNEKNYAFGHDCSVYWSTNETSGVCKINTTFLPEYEITTITPDIYIDGRKIEIRHSELAAANNFEEMSKILQPLISGYKEWAKRIAESFIEPYYQEVKEENIREINHCIKRLTKGLEYLKNPEAFQCFKLTNLAMLMQMNNGKIKRSITMEDNSFLFSDEYFDEFKELDYSSIDKLSDSLRKNIEKANNSSLWKKYKWRGFQIAFLLQSIESIVDKKGIDREIVDLIWFPTGGGKTEAYLGMSAFSMLYRRIINPKDKGVDVMMRYTLRLLTADQFQRSARLICSMEYIRSHFAKILGEDEFSIGLWVGASTTPNTKAQSKNDYRDILNYKRPPFIIESCPWCGAEIKLIDREDVGTIYPGMRCNSEVEAYCPDENCHFHSSLPIYFVDEQLYKNPPTFLIGTIDKFVQLTWVPEARALFGIGRDGNRNFTPPNLIIQDELHLISGPLGTLTGMYEVLIDELTTDYRGEKPIKSKIVGATATIKAYEDQIHAIFGRKKSSLFPPSGIDINDNFFSSVLYDSETGEKAPGRKYLGVYTTTQGKLQSQVQTISALLQQTNKILEDERDPFWTILSFYNSLRDIGTAITLLEQDIPNNMINFYRHRNILDGRLLRKDGIKELTSRMASATVSKSISDLKVPYGSDKFNPIDVCLASNIIEVGVDIDRLSLMTIVGQPKTTSQYIQVSGRVGRRTEERPGLVVVIYNPNNSIDKSHFEHFIEYHQKLYAQVEVSSVTPFSNFSIRRGLPAALIGYIRQNFEYKTLGLRPNQSELNKESRKISEFIAKIMSRAKEIDADNSEVEHQVRIEARKVLEKLLDNDYEDWKWSDKKKGFMVPMANDTKELSNQVEPIIFSMRNVDASARLTLMKINTDDSLKQGGFSF